jgi:hypothetical protein
MRDRFSHSMIMAAIAAAGGTVTCIADATGDPIGGPSPQPERPSASAGGTAARACHSASNFSGDRVRP